ncbi:hypothetical protein EVAR_64536_1 [Eumeta japonica]|uniref:Uncharacterized protein n=1 Tax=Eumeta variegata TaxID=151549 RepID=A0A4C1ZW92_EUMVA|nr:hypothetical protein EVAR_64536_1 [Eumeta japonica]
MHDTSSMFSIKLTSRLPLREKRQRKASTKTSSILWGGDKELRGGINYFTVVLHFIRFLMRSRSRLESKTESKSEARMGLAPELRMRPRSEPNAERE